MLSRIIRGNAALYAQFGWMWIACVVTIGLFCVYALLLGTAGLLIVGALALVLLQRACIDAMDGIETQADREFRLLAAQHRAPIDIELEAARRRLSEPTIHLVMPNLGDGQEL